jgi:predicted transcriptional regulator
MTVKDEHANLVIESDIEKGILILVQLESIVVHVAIALNFIIAIKDFEIYVRVEET